MIYLARLATALLLSSCVALITSGCSDSNNDDSFDLSPVDPPANPIQPANVSQPEWLYVQTAATAQMTSDTTLEIPFTRDVFGFTDRPYRQHAYFTASEFEAFWSEEGANSFSEVPPNAVLTWLEGEEPREAEITLNSATVYADGTQESLVYEITLETEQMPDAQMSYVSLFVDSNTDCSLGKEKLVILIADDSRFERVIAAKFLNDNGITNIVEASNGNEAISQFRTYKPNLVLMDINMPELDGITALKEIVPEGAKVIMLTMDGQQEFIVQADKAGALGYIAKPFSENQLMEKVNSVLCPSS
jgi:two-component system chemotaxis response regulator CheY